MSRLLIPLFAFALFVLAPMANAQQSYAQPMLGVSTLTSHTLLVKIPTSPTWAYQAMVNAIVVWNQAQKWFTESYEPNHLDAIFILTPTNGTYYVVNVQWVQDTGQSWFALTSANGQSIAIIISRLKPCHPCTGLTYNEMPHELGHSLGLADIVGSGNDLMYSNPETGYPSTLNLYAVYLEALGRSFEYGDKLNLPAYIPYSHWNPSAVPVVEFPNSLPMLLISVLTLAIAMSLRKRKGRKRHSPSSSLCLS